MTKNALDMIDEKIVELLQENARIAIKEIAAQVFLVITGCNSQNREIGEQGNHKGLSCRCRFG